MMTWRQRWTDQRVEEVISTLLRIGVTSAAVVTLAGGLLYLMQSGSGQPHYHQFHGEPQQLLSLGAMLLAVIRLDSRAIIQFGLLLLILTPIARVVFSVFAFIVQDDHFYVAVTCIVLAVLTVNLFWG